MKTEESIHDDERLFIEYFKAIISGRNKSLDKVALEKYATCTHFAIAEHRKRFTRGERAK